MSGIECIKKIKEKCPGTQFMMFTVYENDEKVLQALQAGATGLFAEKNRTTAYPGKYKRTEPGRIAYEQ